MLTTPGTPQATAAAAAAAGVHAMTGMSAAGFRSLNQEGLLYRSSWVISWSVKSAAGCSAVHGKEAH
jgi:hypothetical protein